MIYKHPRDMTRDELLALPVVNHLFKREARFRDPQGRRWGVGRSGNMWVKAVLPDEPDPQPPAASAAIRRRP